MTGFHRASTEHRAEAFSNWLLALVVACGCNARRLPPGAQSSPSSAPAIVDIGNTPERADSGDLRTASTLGGERLGSPDDNVPFSPNGLRLASIAWRTWIYTDTGPERTRYGYLRVGALVDARGPAIRNEGCPGGWYRINPRGFVCVGRGATLELKDPLLAQSAIRAARGRSLPYLYALSDDMPPLLYFRLPSRAQMLSSEGESVPLRAARWRERATVQGLTDLLGELGGPPGFLGNGAELVKPYGVATPMRYLAHAGRASVDSGFAVQQVFAWEDRSFGLTTEHDIIALDNTKLVRPSDLRGVELGENEDLPVAFVMSHYAPKYLLNDAGVPRQTGIFRYREGVKITGSSLPGGLHEVADGSYVADAALRVIEPRKSFPSFATGTRKWIDISIRHQTLVAYVGEHPVYATLVSTGRAGLLDPEKTESTPRGTFMVHAKHVSATMDGEEDKSDSFNLRDVPFVQYFHKGYALHGTYWHDDFGKVRSHGCVNLAPQDAAWLFEWTDPSVPPDWHGVINLERGTVVYVRP
ncbi:MAG TPA: L,D-transpeptidase [Polyangiaceae bacterium]|jgi:lipoprotein-anchoring transpeptidase ErfK/SrfK